jgi:gas vesicle protein
MHNNNPDIPGLITGIILGGLLGILYAPNKGEQTREKLKGFAQDKVEDFQGTLEEKRDALAADLRKIEDEIKDKAKDIQRGAEDTVNKAQNKR